MFSAVVMKVNNSYFCDLKFASLEDVAPTKGSYS